MTCAKLLASIYARLGNSVQTFGDYAGERSGAPVRAYTRVSDTPIAGAWARIFDVPMAILEETYGQMGFEGNLSAARDALAVRTYDSPGERLAARARGPALVVEPFITHVEGPPTPVKTGSWRSQMPQWIVGRAPCTAACPVDNDVVGFVRALDVEGPAADAPSSSRASAGSGASSPRGDAAPRTQELAGTDSKLS